jgi:hypothetical protein
MYLENQTIMSTLLSGLDQSDDDNEDDGKYEMGSINNKCYADILESQRWMVAVAAQ